MVVLTSWNRMAETDRRNDVTPRSLAVTGASGLLGSAVVRAGVQRGWITAAFFKNWPLEIRGATCRSLDITDKQAVMQCISTLRPELIINCAAATDVDRCESHPDEARRVNCDGASNVAEAASVCGAQLIQISTDAVFDGCSRRYGEDELTAPRGVYARTKLDAEQVVASIEPGALIVRTTMFGTSPRPGHGLAEWLIGRLGDGQPIHAYSDVVFSPLLVSQLSGQLLTAADWNLAGVYHAAAIDGVSKLEFALMIARAFGFSSGLVVPALSTESNLVVPRHGDTSLDGSRWLTALGLSGTTVQQAINQFAIEREPGGAVGVALGMPRIGGP